MKPQISPLSMAHASGLLAVTLVVFCVVLWIERPSARACTPSASGWSVLHDTLPETVPANGALVFGLRSLAYDDGAGIGDNSSLDAPELVVSDSSGNVVAGTTKMLQGDVETYADAYLGPYKITKHLVSWTGALVADGEFTVSVVFGSTGTSVPTDGFTFSAIEASDPSVEVALGARAVVVDEGPIECCEVELYDNCTGESRKSQQCFGTVLTGKVALDVLVPSSPPNDQFVYRASVDGQTTYVHRFGIQPAGLTVAQNGTGIYCVDLVRERLSDGALFPQGELCAPTDNTLELAPQGDPKPSNCLPSSAEGPEPQDGGGDCATSAPGTPGIITVFLLLWLYVRRRSFHLAGGR